MPDKLKKLVRARMVATGQSYQGALRDIRAQRPQPLALHDLFEDVPCVVGSLQSDFDRATLVMVDGGWVRCPPGKMLVSMVDIASSTDLRHSLERGVREAYGDNPPAGNVGTIYVRQAWRSWRDLVGYEGRYGAVIRLPV